MLDIGALADKFFSVTSERSIEIIPLRGSCNHHHQFPVVSLCLVRQQLLNSLDQTVVAELNIVGHLH